MDDFYMCECHSEGISVCLDDPSDPNNNFIGLSMWRYGSYRLRLSRKLSLIWHIIKYGHPWLDDVLLSREKARKLADKLLELTGGLGAE